MPLLKQQKIELAKEYQAHMSAAKNAVMVAMHGIPVNEIAKVRIDVANAQGALVVVKKRVFVKSLANDVEAVEVEALPGSVMVLYSANEEDEHAPLKELQKRSKQWKKAKATFGIEYVGGWYDKKRQDAAYVTELADLPTAQELVGKLVFMLNHPVSSFARVLQAIADQSDQPSEETKEDASASEVKEENKEESKEEPKEEPKEEQESSETETKEEVKAESKEEPKEEPKEESAEAEETK